MNKDLPNMDEAFSSAYRQFEEQPSGETWEKINATLDKKDAENYKRKFIGLKRISLLLLFLLTGILIYEAGFIKRSPVLSNQNALTKETSTILRNETNKQQSFHSNNPVSKNSLDTIISENPGDNKFKVDDKKELLYNTSKNSFADENSFTGKSNSIAANDIIKMNASFLNNDREELLSNKEKFSGQRPIIAPLFTNEIVAIGVTGKLVRPVRFPLINQPVSSGKIENKKNHFKTYWTLTSFASYNEAGYKLDSDLPNAVNRIKFGEVHEPSFSIGLLATRQVKKRWGLQTGLIFSNTVIGISPQKMYALQDPAGSVGYKYITSSGYTYIKPGFGLPPLAGDSLTTAEAKHTLHSVSIPVAVKYRLSKKRFSFIPGIGIEANFLTSAKLETEIQDASNKEIVFINKLDGSKSFYWSFVADAELQYKVNKKMSVNLRPAFKHALSPITKNNVVETFPYSFGVGLGLTYKF